MMLKTALAIITLMYATRNFADGQTYKKLKDFNKDTAAYLKLNFIDHKSQYIGSPVNVLMSALEIPIAQFYPIDVNNKPYVNSFSFLFYNDVDRRAMVNGHSFVGLAITFAPPISDDSIDTYYNSKYFRSKNPLPWTKTQKLFFGNRIVKDIEKIFN